MVLRIIMGGQKMNLGGEGIKTGVPNDPRKHCGSKDTILAIGGRSTSREWNGGKQEGQTKAEEKRLHPGYRPARQSAGGLDRTMGKRGASAADRE